MRLLTAVFVAVGPLFFLLQPARADIITPTGAKATSQFGIGITVGSLINGSGLADGVHDIDEANMWFSGCEDAGVRGGSPPACETFFEVEPVDEQIVEFTLNTTYELSAALIHQYNRGDMDGVFLGRGVKSLEILVSPNFTDPFVSLGTFELAIGSGEPEPAQTVALEGADMVRRVRFQILENHGGEAEPYAGLSEVRFDGTAVAPEPPASQLSLGDMVAGGDGTGTGRPAGSGINLDTGVPLTLEEIGESCDETVDTDGVNPAPVPSSVFIDQVFFINGQESTAVNSSGVEFTWEEMNPALSWAHVIANSTLLVCEDEEVGLQIGGRTDWESGIGLHTAAGITFNLNALRAGYGEDVVKSFSTFAGEANFPEDCSGDGSAGTRLYIIYSDAEDVIESYSIEALTSETEEGFVHGGEDHASNIPPEAGYLTLAVGALDEDPESNWFCDYAGFANAIISSEEVVKTIEDEVGLWCLEEGTGLVTANSGSAEVDGKLINMDQSAWARGVSGLALSFDGDAGNSLNLGGPPLPGCPAGFWTFDEAEGDTAPDGSIAGNDGLLEGDAAFVDDPERGSVVSLSGEGWISTGAPVLELGDGVFTVSAWVKTAQAGVAIVSKQSDDGEWEEAEKKFYLSAGDERAEVPGTVAMVGWGTDWIHTDEPVVNDDEWHHVALAYNRDLVFVDEENEFPLEAAAVYIDGVSVELASFDYNGLADNDGDLFYIGRTPGGEDVENFVGLIDDVAVYQAFLGEAEVQAVMGGDFTLSGFCPPADDPGPYNLREDYSWAAWINTTDDAGTILSKHPLGVIWDDSLGSHAMFVEDGNVVVDVGFLGGVGSEDHIVNDGEWHHVAMTVDMNVNGTDTDVLQIYIDGEPDGLIDDWDMQTDGDGEPFPPEAPAGDLHAGNALVNIAGELEEEFPPHYTGLIDDIRFWDFALSPEQVAAVASDAGARCPPAGELPDSDQDGIVDPEDNCPTVPNPDQDPAACDIANEVGLWCLEDGGGLTATNSGSTGNDGELRNMDVSAWVEGGLSGLALSFDGDDDFLDLGDSGAYNMREDYSWAVWVNTEDDFGAILTKHPEGAIWDDVPGSHAVYIDEDVVIMDVGFLGGPAAERAVNDGEWHHVALTVDMNIGGTETDVAKIYIDGELEAVEDEWDMQESGDPEEAPFSEDAPEGPLRAAAGAVGEVDDDFPGQYEGLMDDIRFWDFAISAEDVAALAEEAGARCPPPGTIQTSGQVPGDANQDGILDIADGVKLIRFVFSEFFPDPLPCETDEANEALLDWTGSGGVNAADVSALLDWLFLGGGAHALGDSRDGCIGKVQIPGCPNVCQ